MKRFPVKLVGLGIAALAGSALASDDGQKAPPPAAHSEANQIVQVSEPAPFPLPPVVQFSPAPGALDRNDPLWFSAARPPAPPAGPIQASGVENSQSKVITSSPLPATPGGTACPSCEAPNPPHGVSPADGALQLRPIVAIRTVEFANAALAKPLAARFLLTWMQVDVTAETWPPSGPRVGLVPCALPSPVPNCLPVAQPIAANAQPEGSPAAVNQLPLPSPLQAQATPPTQQSPAQQSPSQQLPTQQLAMQPPIPRAIDPKPESALPVLQQMARPGDVANPSSSSPQIPLPSPQPSASQLLPAPRSLLARDPIPAPPAQPQPLCELPTAPPDLMVPYGPETAGKHGGFNSEPIRLSHDFPSVSDVFGTPLRDRIRDGLAEDPPAVDRGYVEVEELMWWMSGMHAPPLATTSTSPTGTGFLGAPGAVPLLGPGTFLGSYRDGIRLRAGAWLDDCSNWGIEGSFFILGQRDADAAYGYNQYGVITRPVFSPNPIPGTSTIIGETGEAVTVPGVLAGVLTVHAQSVLFGADANLTSCLFRDCDSRATLFVGYRNLDLLESLTINENIQVIGSGGTRITTNDPVGTLVGVRDRFGTQNCFNGGQVGATYEQRWGRFDVEGRASIAFGVTDQQLDVSGFQNVTLPGRPTQTFRGGLLAVGPNLGDFSRDRFSVAPELTLNAGYWLSSSLRVHVGYNFLYWTDVIRPGEQIDRVVNLSYVPNAPPVGASNQVRPQPLFAESNMLVHGVEFGLEWRW